MEWANVSTIKAAMLSQLFLHKNRMESSQNNDKPDAAKSAVKISICLMVVFKFDMEND